MRWTCAILLLLAGGCAETRVVIEDFATTTELWTDTGEVLGLPESVQPPVGTIQLTTEGETLRVDYDVAFTALYGSLTLGRVLNGTTYDQCANATHVSLKYKVLEPQSRPHLGSLFFSLLDGSDCSGPVCAQGEGTALEIWMHFDPFRLDDTSGEWRELRLGLCGRSGTTRTPFFNMDGFYANGNYILDPGFLQGFVLGVQAPSDRTGEATSGSLLFDEIACIEDVGADPCAEPTNRTGAALNEVQFDAAAAGEVHVYGHQQCDELCAASETCLYYMIYGGLDALALRFPTCYLFSTLHAEDIRPASAEFETSALESFWVRSEAKRGALCDVCSCVSSAAYCTNRDLKTVPFGSDPITSLDLRGNPQLVLIGPGAFETSLETLYLPSGITHVAPEALLALPALREVSLAEDGDSVPRNFVDASGSGRFHDVCCGRGASVADISFCAFEPDLPGKSDTMYREFERTAFDAIIAQLPALVLYVPSSPFLAEASESVDNCAAVCAMNARCLSFSFYIRTDQETSNSPTASARCHLYTEAPPVSAYEGASAPDPDDPDPRVHIIGLPPRTRAARNSTVVVTPASLTLSEANEYKGSFELSLGAAPLRGAVWVTPRLDSNLDVTFVPPSVSLYDATTRVTIEVTVRGGVTRDFTPTVTFDVEACDQAFVEEPPTLQLDILAPPSSSKNNARRARRQRRSLIIAFAVIGAVVGALLLLWAAVKVWRFAKKKQSMEVDRTMHVRRQVAEAMKHVEEFQAAYATLPGDKFVDLKRLKAHETLRDERLLIVYDSLASVRTEMRRGTTFVFVSHQWLAFDQPDPHGVHFASIKQAIRNVADENELPLSSIRVWVDIFSIPQKNRSEQRLAIASLPTFASACNYFVVVAPNTKHLDTGCDCDSKTYRKRAWCRAEIMSCWARNGTDCMFVSTNQGLRSLADNEQVLLEALDVMDGDLTCCRLGFALCHARGEPCDREELMLPMLGLYTEIYRGRHGERAEAYAFVEPIKDKLYPRSFTYTYKDADGVNRSEESVLFGDLVKAAELAVDLSLADPDDPLWRSGLPDLAPGTDAPERSHHLESHHATRLGSKPLTLKRSLSTLVSPVPSDVMRMPPLRLRSEYSTTSNRSGDGISPLPPSAPPDRGGRPQLLRSMTWRASAPTLPGLDDDSDRGDGMDV